MNINNLAAFTTIVRNTKQINQNNSSPRIYNNVLSADKYENSRSSNTSFGRLVNSELLAKAKSILQQEIQTEFDENYFAKWAEQNNLSLSYENEWGSHCAYFIDARGNLIRRITEDRDNPGKVYSDNIRYYQQGEFIIGMSKFADTEMPRFYDRLI